jgi:hypothetical protein
LKRQAEKSKPSSDSASPTRLLGSRRSGMEMRSITNRRGDNRPAVTETSPILRRVGDQCSSCSKDGESALTPSCSPIRQSQELSPWPQTRLEWSAEVATLGSLAVTLRAVFLEDGIRGQGRVRRRILGKDCSECGEQRTRGDGESGCFQASLVDIDWGKNLLDASKRAWGVSERERSALLKN